MGNAYPNVLLSIINLLRLVRNVLHLVLIVARFLSASLVLVHICIVMDLALYNALLEGLVISIPLQTI